MNVPSDPQSAANELRIGLWGAARSGKTLLLAAMYATMFHGPEQGNAWEVSAPGDSLLFLETADETLAERMLPPATTLASVYDFLIRGKELVEEGGNWWRTPTNVERPVSFKLVVQDPPGIDFGRPKAQQTSQYLATCAGIVLVFDPIRELEATTDTQRNLASIQPTLARLQSDATVSRDGSGRLPHVVAACLTKYDDPRVFERLKRLDQIDLDHNVPRVRNVEAAFDALQGKGIRDLLKRSFHQVEFFAVSSIGFAPGRFDPVFYNNLVETAAGPRLKGEVAPVGVMTPFLWIERTLRTGK